MHEASIADYLLELVVREAGAHEASRVTGIVVEIGAFELVVPEMLATAFTFASQGTIAEGAELRLVEVAARAICRGCGHAYQPEMGNFACPACRQADADLTAGRGLVLKSVELEVE